MPTNQIEIGDFEKLSISSSSTSSESIDEQAVHHNGGIDNAGGVNSIYTNHNIANDFINIAALLAPLQHYQPIQLPKEPSLEELLYQLSQTRNLSTLNEVKLKISSNIIGLQRLSTFLPNLTILNLEGSIVESLRDLGCNLNLIHLNVSRCNLKNFDGINGFSNTLEQLICDYNFITQVQPLCNLTKLKILSLRGNQIKNLDTIEFLILCTELTELNLMENDVTKTCNYHTLVKDLLPQLQILDYTLLYNNQIEPLNSISSSEYCPSLSTSSVSSLLTSGAEELNKSQEPNKQSEYPVIKSTIDNVRPASCSDIPTNKLNKIVLQRRPASCDSYPKNEIKKSLLLGEPIYGNVISKIRKQRLKSAWNEHSDSLEETTKVNELIKFPKILPQKNIPLQMGVTADIQSNVTLSLSDNKLSTLLTFARKWRSTSQQSRKKS